MIFAALDQDQASSQFVKLKPEMGCSLCFKNLLMPKCQSSSFEVTANVSFQDCYFNTHSTNINKRGISMGVLF